jgi:hypothetical protein
VYSDAAGRGAALAGGAEAAPDGAVHREVELGVIHHEDDVLAAHLEVEVLEHRRAGLRDGAAHRRRARERHDADGVVAHERLPDGDAGAGDHVHDPRRQPRFLEGVEEVHDGERRVRGGLDHHGVAEDQGRHHLPRRDGHGEVPRSHEAGHSYRHPHGHLHLLLQLGRRRLAELAASLAGHVIRHVDGFLDVAFRLVQDLAHLARHVPCEVVLAAHEDLGGAVEDLAAFGCGRIAPARERVAGGGDGGFHVLGPRLGEAADQVVAVGGVAILEGRAGGGRNPAPADVVAVVGHVPLAFILLPRKALVSGIG